MAMAGNLALCYEYGGRYSLSEFVGKLRQYYNLTHPIPLHMLHRDPPVLSRMTSETMAGYCAIRA